MLESINLSAAAGALAPSVAEVSVSGARAAPPPHILGAVLRGFRRLDARLFQILFLGTLLLFGALLRDFALQWEQVALTFAAGLAAQAFWIAVLGLKNVGYLSALVTCLGTSILVRADSLCIRSWSRSRCRPSSRSASAASTSTIRPISP